jgi:hypothetical protein
MMPQFLLFATKYRILLIISFVFSFLLLAQFVSAELLEPIRQAEAQTDDSKQSKQAVDEKPHNVVAAFYDVQNFPSAKLLLNNKDIVAREVRPTLYNLDGNILEIAPVMIEANSHLMINLQDWANLGGESFRQGSIKLFHTGKDLVIGSQIYLEDTTQSLSFEERFTELGKFDSRRLESIWWMPRNQAQVTIILSNTSEQTLTITAKLSRKPKHTGEPQIFTLLPHQTRVLDLKSDFTDGDQFASSEIVGLSLEHTGGKSALKAHGQIKDTQAGYSNIISFGNPNTAKSSELHGTGLHLGTIGDESLEPIVAVKNVGTERTNVTAKVPYTRTDGTSEIVNLNSINLQAGEMRLLNMNKVIQISRREQIQIAGIEIEYDTAPGSVITIVQSVGESKSQVYRVPMGDPSALLSSTGGYPWRIEETSSTFAYIKNTTNLEQEYVAYLTWANGGEYMIGLEKIAPHKTVQLDVKKLRDEQTTDERGNTIPINVNDGQIKWTIRSEEYVNDTDIKKFALTGRSEQIDTINGVSSSYACHNCCQKDAYGWISSGGVTEAEVGDQIQFTAYEQGSDCYGYPYSFQMDNDDVDWDSSNDNIATVSNLGLVTIVGVGEVEIDGDWLITRTSNYGGYCPTVFKAEQGKVKSKLEEKSDAVEMLVPDCSVCSTESARIDSDVDIVAKPKVTINVPATAKDGDTVTFSVTSQGGTPSAYLWSFEPTSGGNNPQVNFTAPTAQTTEAKAHWFAKPDTPCAELNSTYTIKVKVTFQSGSPITKQAPFTVSVGSNWGGKVLEPTIEGQPKYEYDNERQVWTIVGPDTLQRVPKSIVMREITETSQFYIKIYKHEEVHDKQWREGMLSDLYTVDSLMPRLLLLTDPELQPLQQKFFEAKRVWIKEQDRVYSSRSIEVEKEAHAVSDPIEPKYIFQLQCMSYGR